MNSKQKPPSKLFFDVLAKNSSISYKSGNQNSSQNVLKEVEQVLEDISKKNLKPVCIVSVNDPIIVFKAESNVSVNKKFHCVKINSCMRAATNEASILQALSDVCNTFCQFFPRLENYFEVPNKKKYFAIVTEWVDSEPIYSVFKTSIKSLKMFTTQLVFLLHHLQASRVISRDIKPSNLLVCKHYQTILVCDFDLGLYLPGTEYISYEGMKVPGTPGFIDPSFFVPGSDLTKCDIYSAGKTLAALVANVEEKDVQKIKTSNLVKLACNRISSKSHKKNFHDLLHLMVNRDSKKRGTTKDLVMHPFVCS